MKNKFEKWNNIKQKIHFGKKALFYVKQREIWSTRMGQNIGFEEDGKGKTFERPILVLKKIGILYLGLSLTTSGKENDFYLKLPNNISRKNSYLILSQPKLFDIKRFHYKIGVVSKDNFKQIQKKLKTLWF